MDERTKVLVTVGVTALGTLLIAIVSSTLVILKDYLQGKWSRQADRERWLRDKLHEIYSNCILYTSYGPMSNYIYKGDAVGHEFELAKYLSEGYRLQEVRNAECQKWLHILAVYHPARGTPAFDDFMKKLQNKEIKSHDIIELAASDPRLKVDFKPEKDAQTKCDIGRGAAA